ncbi:MAG: DNA polymerase III subunit beta [Deltaproteobacteria bacterium]|nr:DNA polymerase III subunit beta [Deltaproteobacteria bacterium]
MEFKIAKNDFLNLANKVHSIAEKRTSQNVASNIFIESVDSNSFRAVATDYDVEFSGIFPAEIGEQGKMTMNGQNLYEIAKSLTSDIVGVKRLENDWAEITAGQTDFKVLGIDPEIFPELTVPEKSDQIVIKKEVLKGIFEKTSFAMSNEETRPNLNGVFLSFSSAGKGGIRITGVATDGYRLSQVEAEAEGKYNGQGSFKGVEVIIHRRGVSEFSKFIEGEEEHVGISFQHNKTIFRCGTSYLMVRQIDELFPDYKRIIPESFKTKFAVDKGPFADVLRRVVITAPPNGLVRFEIKKGLLKLHTEDANLGESNDEILVEQEGDNIELFYNFKYVLDALGVFAKDQVKFKIKDQTSATLLEVADEKGIIELVMPMRA